MTGRPSDRMGNVIHMAKRAIPARVRSLTRTFIGRYHRLVSPRLFLLLIAGLFTVVGVETFLYPPDFLRVAALWAVVALVTAGGCVHAAVKPSRFIVSLAGALVVCASVARALANLLEPLADGEPWPTRIVAASMWLLIAHLALAAWFHFVTPWSAGRRLDP